MTLTFPVLTPAHAGRVGQVLTTMDPWQHLGFGAQVLTDYLNRHDSALDRHAIIQHGHLVGAIAVRSPWLRGPYLELLAVFPQTQGKGIGSKALNWAFEHARTSKAVNFWACVSAFNLAARGFYAHMGFTETTELTDLVVSGENEILLRKIL